MKKTNYYSIFATLLLGVNLCFAQTTDITPPKSYFDFEEGDVAEGTALVDEGAASNNGEIVGTGLIVGTIGVKTESDDKAGCVEFAGDGESYVKIPYNDYLNAPNYTLSIWVKFVSADAWGAYIFWADGDPYPPKDDVIPSERHIDTWVVPTIADGAHGFRCSIDEDGSDDETQISIDATEDLAAIDYLSDEAWHLYAITLEENKTIKMYIDGAFVNEATLEAGVIENTKQADLWIGKRSGNNKNITAFFDRFRVWDETLTADQIKALSEYEGPDGGDASKVNWVTDEPGNALFKTNTDVASLSNYPNPFNKETNVAFTLNNASNIELSIINTAGKKVASVLNEYKAEGMHTISINADQLNAGVYFLQLETNAGVTTTKMLITE